MIRRITHDTTCKTAACESACYAPKAPPPLCLHLPLLLRWYYLLLLVPGPIFCPDNLLSTSYVLWLSLRGRADYTMAQNRPVDEQSMYICTRIHLDVVMGSMLRQLTRATLDIPSPMQ